MTVTITNPLDGSQETLTANTAGTAIAASYSGGVLALSGSDTAADYQRVLESVTYSDAAADPNLTARVITVVATDGTTSSNTVTATLAINAGHPANRERLHRDAGRERHPRRFPPGSSPRTLADIDGNPCQADRDHQPPGRRRTDHGGHHR